MGKRSARTEMVPHVVPPREEVRVHIVVLVPDELAEDVDTVKFVENA